MYPLLTPMEEDEDRTYIPSQPHTEDIVNQPFNIDNNDTTILGPRVSPWQESWYNNSLYLLLQRFLKGR